MAPKIVYIDIILCLCSCVLNACSLLEPSFPTIEVKNCEAISPNEFLSYLQYTPLETPDSLTVAEVNKFIVFEDRYYILDNQMEGEVYCFRQNGEFLFRLNAQGVGDGKYKYLENIAIDPHRRLLEVYDRGGLKLIRYDLEGNFVEEIPCPYYFEDFALVDSNLYAVYGLGISNFFSLNDSSFDSFMIIDRNFKSEIIKGLPYIDPLHNVFFEGRLWKQNRMVWGTYGFEDTIYEISVDTISAVFYVDFGGNRMPENLKTAVLESDSAMDRLVELLDAPYAKGIHHLLKTEQHLSFDFRTTDKQHFQAIYDLYTQDCECVPNFYFKEGMIYQSPIAVDVDTFVSLFFSGELMDSLKNVDESLFSDDLLEVKSKFKDGNNPVVLRMVYQ